MQLPADSCGPIQAPFSNHVQMTYKCLSVAGWLTLFNNFVLKNTLWAKLELPLKGKRSQRNTGLQTGNQRGVISNNDVRVIFPF